MAIAETEVSRGWWRRVPRPRLPELILVAAAVLVLLAPSWWGESAGDKQRRDEVDFALRTAVNAGRTGFQDWSEELRLRIGLAVEVSELQNKAKRQIKQHERGEELSGVRLEKLRDAVTRIVDTNRFGRVDQQEIRGFRVLDFSGTVVAADSDFAAERFGEVPAEALGAALAGATIVSPSRIGRTTESANSWPIWVLAPIRMGSSDRTQVGVIAVEYDAAVRAAALSARAVGSVGKTVTVTANGVPLGNHDAARVKCISSLFDAHSVRGIPVDDRVHLSLDGLNGCDTKLVVGWGAVDELGLSVWAILPHEHAFASHSQMSRLLPILLLLLGLSLFVERYRSGNSGISTVEPSKRARRIPRNSLAWGVLAGCLAVTWAFYLTVKRQVSASNRKQLEHQAEHIHSRLVERARLYGHAVDSIVPAVSPDTPFRKSEWRRVAELATVSPITPGIERIDFIRATEGSVGRAIRGYGAEFLSQAPSEWPLIPEVIEAANAARFEFATVFGKPVNLQSGRQVMVIASPVYRADTLHADSGNAPTSPYGWLVAAVAAQEFFQGLGIEELHLEFALYGNLSGTADRLIYDSDGEFRVDEHSSDDATHYKSTLRIPGRDWLLTVEGESGALSPLTHDYPEQVLLGGLAISVLLFDIVLVMSSTRARALGLAELMSLRFRENDVRMRAVVDNAPDAIITFDGDGKIHNCNPAAEATFRSTESELVGSPIQDYLDGLSVEGESAIVAEASTLPVRETTGRRSDGQTFPAELTLSQMELRAGRMFSAIVRDISERKQAEEALYESEERFALAARGVNDGLWDWNLKTDEVYYSDRWRDMLGIKDKVGNSPAEWLDRVHPEDIGTLKRNLDRHIEGRSEHFECEHRVLHSNGTHRWVLSRAIAVRDETGVATRIAGSQTDITDRKEAERQLRWDALHDPLTALPNRSYFMRRLRGATDAHNRGAGLFAVLFLDLDRFKVVNDSLGHVVGDKLLFSIANRLQGCLRPGDTICRLGGDEFAVLLERLSGQDEAAKIAERLQDALERPLVVANQEVFTAVSIGIALSSGGRHSAEELLRDADTAMYRAKAQGKARYQLFDSNMHTKAVERLDLESSIRPALDRDEFVVHYQPIVSLETGQVTSCEALIRWVHPERGVIPPADFIPIAEDTGVIVPIGAWMLNESCKQLRAWIDAGLPRLRMSVNISPRQLEQPAFVEMVETTARKYQIPPELLQLELTETTLMESDTIGSLHELFSSGFRIALDDFGTGYSSLRYLRHFPINTLKLDKSFVREIATDPVAASITTSLISMAHNLKLSVVVEGVEEPSQLEFLRRTGCDEVQGFLVSEPVPADLFVQMLNLVEPVVSGLPAVPTSPS